MSDMPTAEPTDPGALTAAELRTRAVQRLTALGEMTGGIAHDFGNILAVIESGLRLAERNADSPEQVRQFIAGARDGVDRGLKLTAQLLTFAKQQELETRPVDANEMLRRLELFLKYGAGARLRIVMRLADDIPKCHVDVAQFNAAILNLVINARDATPNGGEILITTDRYQETAAPSNGRQTKSYVRVQVKDQGKGMSEETLAKIFDPFFTTKGAEGTGLGLPQVCAFMRMIGGDLKVDSQLGSGTTFDLLFPAEG
jgi:signal transduction histidine kinase